MDTLREHQVLEVLGQCVIVDDGQVVRLTDGQEKNYRRLDEVMPSLPPTLAEVDLLKRVESDHSRHAYVGSAQIVRMIKLEWSAEEKALVDDMSADQLADLEKQLEELALTLLIAMSFVCKTRVDDVWYRAN